MVSEATMAAVAGAIQNTSPTARRAPGAAPDKEKEKRYKCQFCNRAFSRSEHRSRHERSRKSVPNPEVKASRGSSNGAAATRDGRKVGWRGNES
jgi:hypothetical protein